MKKTIYLLFVVILTGCASSNLELWDTELRALGYDFRPYTDQGFLFTPESYNEAYDAVGLVEIIYIPKIIKAPSSTTTRTFSESRPMNRDGFSILLSGIHYYYVERPDTEKLIAEMYDLASGFGADALSNFNITTEVIYNNDVAIATIKVTGFAIKRL